MTGAPDGTFAEARFAALEQRLQRLRILVWLCFAVAASALAYGLYAQSTAAVSIGRLWMAKDEQGRLRGMFGVSAQGVGLTMYDTNGQMRVDLGIAPGEIPGLLILSPHGEPIATLNLIDGRIPTLRLSSPGDSTRIQLTPRAQGPVLEVRNRPGGDSAIGSKPR